MELSTAIGHPQSSPLAQAVACRDTQYKSNRIGTVQEVCIGLAVPTTKCAGVATGTVLSQYYSVSITHDKQYSWVLVLPEQFE